MNQSYPGAAGVHRSPTEKESGRAINDAEYQRDSQTYWHSPAIPSDDRAAESGRRCGRARVRGGESLRRVLWRASAGQQSGQNCRRRYDRRGGNGGHEAES
jgi:hypothetical protein